MLFRSPERCDGIFVRNSHLFVSLEQIELDLVQL